jgi:hypothetical protein
MNRHLCIAALVSVFCVNGVVVQESFGLGLDVNKDLTNTGPSPGYDLTVILEGLEDTDYIEQPAHHYDGNDLPGHTQGTFGDFDARQEDGNTILQWTDFKDNQATGDKTGVDTGQTIHVGWGTKDGTSSIKDMYWTSKSHSRIPASVVYNITSGYIYGPHKGQVKQVWHNTFDPNLDYGPQQSIAVSNVQYALLERPLRLDELNAGNTWLSAQLRSLPGGTSFEVPFDDSMTLPIPDVVGVGTAVVLRYEVSAPGSAAQSVDFVQSVPLGPKVAWVSFHTTDAATANAATAGFVDAPDKGYTDLLTAYGYEVTRVLQSGTPDVNLLNSMDLVIISRSVASGSFQNANADNWNTQITAPIMNLNGYTIRKNRLGFMTGDTIPDTTGDIKLKALDPTHPIFAGIALTNGIMMTNNYAGICTYPDEVTVARGISIVTEAPNAEGTVLATVSQASAATGPTGATVIAEWLPGATLTHDGGAGTNVLAGRRLIFLTGSREASGKNSEGTGMIDLGPDGIQMFLNAVAYMMAPLPIPVVNASFEEPQTKCQNWDGGTNSKGTFVDVPGWSSDTMADDSGIEGPDAWPGHTDGVMAGYLMGTDPSVFNTTSQIIGDGNKFVLKVDSRDNWTSDPALPAELKMSLYCDIGGLRLTLAEETVELTTTWTTFELDYTADALAAGLPIGIELKNASNATTDNNSWIGIDNVRLTVQ